MYILYIYMYSIQNINNNGETSLGVFKCNAMFLNQQKTDLPVFLFKWIAPGIYKANILSVTFSNFIDIKIVCGCKYRMKVLFFSEVLHLSVVIHE